MLDIQEFAGLWKRSLIAWPDGREDTTTFVAWLQGPSLFADLRQPANPPSFEGARCLNDLQPKHFEWLSRQEGFAGRFARAGDAFEWQRHIDFQLPGEFADAGYLNFADGVLIERGRDQPYIEHWHRASPHVEPHAAIRMQDQYGRAGFIVRAGEVFMYARDRSEPLTRGGSLEELIKAGSLEQSRRLIDCEISLGRVCDGAWRIVRSSLPFRVGAAIGPDISADHKTITTADISSDGAPFARHWLIAEIDVPHRNPSASNAIGRMFPQPGA